MQKLSRWNKGYKYLLMIIDVFSKYGWIVPVKDKKGNTIAEAFQNVVKKRKPKFLWVDKGKEFYNVHLKKILSANNKLMYSTENEEKSSVVERWNRTIKTKMWKRFTEQNTTQYVEMLPELLREYNNTKHSSIKMTPKQASEKKNEKIVYDNLYGDRPRYRIQETKFKAGDKVRISKYKRKIFDKGYTPNWTEEIFIIDKVQYTDPITYRIKDLLDEEIKGSFYEQELLKTEQEVFRIEKVLRKDHKKARALVKWKGYDDRFNSWVPLHSLEKL